MTGSTHAAAGAALGAIAGALACQPVAGAVVGGIAGLAADVDHPGSKLGRRIRPLAILLEERWGHRESPAHALVLLAPAGFALGLVAGFFLGAPLLALSGVLGATSHLALDGMTKSGVKPFRVWLPKLVLPGWFPVKAQELAERCNARVARVEEKTGKKHYRGDVRTGEDYREHVIAAISWLVVALMVAICK